MADKSWDNMNMIAAVLLTEAMENLGCTAPVEMTFARRKKPLRKNLSSAHAIIIPLVKREDRSKSLLIFGAWVYEQCNNSIFEEKVP